MGRKNLSMALGGALIAGSLGISGCLKKKNAAKSLPFKVKFTAGIEGDAAATIKGRLELSNVKVKGKDGKLAVEEGKKDFPEAWGATGGGGYKVECYVPVKTGEPKKKLMEFNWLKDAYMAKDCGRHNEKVVFLITKREELADHEAIPDENTKTKEYDPFEVALPKPLKLAWKVGDNADGTGAGDIPAITPDNNNGAISRAKPYVALTWDKDEKIVLDYVVYKQTMKDAFRTKIGLEDDGTDHAKLGSIYGTVDRKLGSIYGTVDGKTAGTPQSSPFVLTDLNVDGVDESVNHKDWSAPEGPFKIAVDGNNSFTDGFQVRFTAKATPQKKHKIFLWYWFRCSYWRDFSCRGRGT